MDQDSDPRLIAQDFIAVRPDWLARGIEEEVLEPALPIIDPHHHLWERPGDRYLLPELLADTGSGHDVRATVYVEARSMYRAQGPEHWRSLGETEFANGMAAMSASGGYGTTRACAGIVGKLDLRLGEEVPAILERHVAVAGGRLRGIRNGSAWHAAGIRATSANPPPGLLLDAGFRRGFAALGRLGLSFDGWLLHSQIAEFADLARAFPETVMILDHVGGPIGIGPYVGRRGEAFAEWRQALQALVPLANVHIKLGGLGMHIAGFDFHGRAQPPGSADLARAWKPYIETCIESFGAARCMFESNFPVDKGSCSYRTLWNAFKRLAAGCSAAEKRDLFGATAARVYRLDVALQTQ